MIFQWCLISLFLMSMVFLSVLYLYLFNFHGIAIVFYSNFVHFNNISMAPLSQAKQKLDLLRAVDFFFEMKLTIVRTIKHLSSRVSSIRRKYYHDLDQLKPLKYFLTSIF